MMEIDAANHRGMIAVATLRNELTSIKQELKHHLAAFDSNAADQATASTHLKQTRWQGLPASTLLSHE